MKVRLGIGALVLSLAQWVAPPLALAQVPPAITLASPPTGAVVSDQMPVVVRTQSTYEIKSVVVTVDGASATLALGCTGSFPCNPGWLGTLDLSSLARGAHQLTITVTDVLDNAGTGATWIFLDHAPTIQLLSPQEGDVARPELRIIATCADDDPAGCTSIVAQVASHEHGTFETVASGRAGIDTLVTLTGATRLLRVTATDSAGRQTTRQVAVYLEGSSFLNEVASVPGTIWDANAQKILHYVGGTGTLYVRDRATGTDTQIYASLTNLARHGYLTPAGAAFVVTIPEFPYASLRSSESGVLLDLGGANSSQSLHAEGPFIIWSNGSGGFVDLFRRNVVTGTTVTVASSAGNVENDVAQDGTVAFWDSTYNIGLYKPDGTSTFLTTDTGSQWNVAPRTDGASVVYRKSTPSCCTIEARVFLSRGGSEIELVPTVGFTPGYRIENGWVAFEKPGPSIGQIWRMDAANVQTQLTFENANSALESLGPDGTVSFIRGARRWLARPGFPNVDISTSLGRVMFIEGAPHVVLGSRLYEVVVPALRPDPFSLFFTSQAVGTTSPARTVTLTNISGAPVTVTSATASTGYAVTSNSCGALPANATCAISVTFSPAARGVLEGDLAIETSAGSQAVPLRGLGVEGQAIAFGAAPAITVESIGLVTATGGPSGNPVIFSSLTPNVCTVFETGAVTGKAQGVCTIAANQAGTGEYAAAVQAAQSFNVAAAAPTRLASLSTRMRILTGDDVLIGGFIIEGSTPRTVVVNARGPSLFAQHVAGAMANPTLTLVPASGPPITNDDWQGGPSAAAIRAWGLNPPNPLESSIMATLAPGAYTAIASGVGNSTGIGIVEVFELDQPQVPLVAISTRGRVETGDNVMIGGFLLRGSAPQTVVIRARGPSLGVAGALADPTLTLIPAGGAAITNDDWGTAPNASQIALSGFAPGNARESAILTTLQPGAYTAIVSGVGGTTGIAIVEVYAVD